MVMMLMMLEGEWVVCWRKGRDKGCVVGWNRSEARVVSWTDSHSQVTYQQSKQFPIRNKLPTKCFQSSHPQSRQKEQREIHKLQAEREEMQGRSYPAVGKRRKDDQPARHGETEHHSQDLPITPETHSPTFDDLVLPLPPQETSTHTSQATESLYRQSATLPNGGRGGSSLGF